VEIPPHSFVQSKAYAESLLAQQLETWRSPQVGQSPDPVGQKPAARELQLSELRSKPTDDHPDVITAESDVEALKKEIAQGEAKDTAAELDQSTKTGTKPLQIQNLRAQIFQYGQAIRERTAQQEEIQRQIKLYRAPVESSPAIGQKYNELTRDYETALAFYNDLLSKQDQSAMASDLERHQQGAQFQVLDPASLPDKPSFPNMQLFALGGAGAGLCLGVGFVLLVELFDTSLCSSQNVETILQLPVLAVIPTIGAPTGRE